MLRRNPTNKWVDFKTMIGDLDSNQVPNSITLFIQYRLPKVELPNRYVNCEGVPLLFFQGKLSNLDSG
jgi:hypothetical protein